MGGTHSAEVGRPCLHVSEIDGNHEGEILYVVDIMMKTLCFLHTRLTATNVGL